MAISPLFATSSLRILVICIAAVYKSKQKVV
jgi:hypothetical protein